MQVTEINKCENYKGFIRFWRCFTVWYIRLQSECRANQPLKMF